MRNHSLIYIFYLFFPPLSSEEGSVDVALALVHAVKGEDASLFSGYEL
jgi:hypothetical protein